MKAIFVDLDGTLFDTRKVNYMAYKEAVNHFGYEIDYDYYCTFCNGRHYTEFLPQITTTDQQVLSQMHKIKKQAYSSYLQYARVNEPLVALLQEMKHCCKLAVVTTASQKNTHEILRWFDLESLFDLILTQEDITKTKPDPEGYLKAMQIFGVSPEECLIFEDSQVGIQAAEKSEATVFVVKGYN